MKEFADDISKFYKNCRNFSKWVEKTVGKEEIAFYEQFLLSHRVFKRLVLQTCTNQGLFGKGLNLCHTVYSFKDLRENIVGKAENAWKEMAERGSKAVTKGFKRDLMVVSGNDMGELLIKCTIYLHFNNKFKTHPLHTLKHLDFHHCHFDLCTSEILQMVILSIANSSSIASSLSRELQNSVLHFLAPLILKWISQESGCQNLVFKLLFLLTWSNFFYRKKSQDQNNVLVVEGH